MIVRPAVLSSMALPVAAAANMPTNKAHPQILHVAPCQMMPGLCKLSLCGRMRCRVWQQPDLFVKRAAAPVMCLQAEHLESALLPGEQYRQTGQLMSPQRCRHSLWEAVIAHLQGVAAVHRTWVGLVEQSHDVGMQHWTAAAIIFGQQDCSRSTSEVNPHSCGNAADVLVKAL